MNERDTRGDIMIRQDGVYRAFAEVIEYQQQEDGKFNMNLKVTKGSLSTGEHKVEFLRPYNVLTDGIPVSLS